jgi:hypothetical protein
MSHVLKGGAFAIVADEASTATDHPVGTSVTSLADNASMTEQ